MNRTNLEIIHKWVAETDSYIERQRDIDRAMQWCEEYLRKVELDCEGQKWDGCYKDMLDKHMDWHINICVRYLEKVEAI